MNNIQLPPRRVFLPIVLTILVWTLILAGSLTWNFHSSQQQTMEMAYAEASAIRDKDMAFRRWALRHSGVYVPVTKQAQPSATLAHIPDRDVITTEGLQLTLRAPAIMVREMMDQYASQTGVVGRITGLRYLNPANAPDVWEKQQLEAFVREEKTSVWEVSTLQGQPYLRFLQAWVMDEGCVRCHAVLGYKTGDLRGATGVNLPLAPYYQRIAAVKENLTLTHGAIWLLGLAGIGYAFRAVRRREDRLQHLNRELEQRVEQRSTALNEESRRNALIVQAAMDGFFVATLQGRMLDCNEKYCKMLGYSRAEFLQLSIPQVEAIESTEEIARRIHKILGQGQDRFDTRHRRKDGALLDVEVNVTLASIGEERLFYAFVHDISDRKHAEAVMRQARDEAEQAKESAESANQAKSEFLSRMSHELRTPLNAIIGFAQLLHLPSKSPLTEQQSDNVQEILYAGHHLLVQVNEVLDLSRIESGRIELKLERVSVAPKIANCLAQLRPLAEQRGIEMVNAVEQGANAALLAEWGVLADRMRFNQILLNLLSNAIKYNRENGHVRIGVEFDQMSECLRFEVQDSGRGIPPDQLHRLFKPFERLESSYEGIEGTGIGLALAKQLVEAMRGKIGVKTGVDTISGEGCIFWFTLPAVHLVAADAEPALTDLLPPIPSLDSSKSSEVAAETTPRCAVLYIEDNPANVKLVRKILLGRQNITLLDAHTAEIGLEIARRERPNLILLDINLPGMDGFTALQHLKEDLITQDIPVVAITANALPRDVARGKAAGFVDYLTKPLNISHFIQTIEHCLQRSKETQV